VAVLVAVALGIQRYSLLRCANLDFPQLLYSRRLCRIAPRSATPCKIG